MTRVLVTGGSGVLGRQLVPRLAAAGHTVRVMSRQPRPSSAAPALEWATAELASGEGLVAAVAGVEAVVHAASSPARDTGQVDVDGTQRLIAAARQAGAGHLIYISIVGIDRHPLAYYRFKLATEQVIEQGGMPWTILRTTQFHELIDAILRASVRGPRLELDQDFQYQPLAAAEAAEALAQAVGRGPAGRLPDLAGPELKTAGELARAWLAARGESLLVVHRPQPGPEAAAYRAGLNTTQSGQMGHQRWAEWLAARYGRPSAAGGEAPPARTDAA